MALPGAWHQADASILTVGVSVTNKAVLQTPAGPVSVYRCGGDLT